MNKLNNITNFIKVDDRISTAGQPTKKQFKKIKKEGFNIVINLATCDLKRGAIKQEDKIISDLGMSYFHIPITWEKPEVDRMKLFLILLETLDKKNNKIFIHCIMNYRVSVFIYKYKQYILKQKGVKLIAPKLFKPSKKWAKIIKMKL